VGIRGKGGGHFRHVSLVVPDAAQESCTVRTFFQNNNNNKKILKIKKKIEKIHLKIN